LAVVDELYGGEGREVRDEGALEVVGSEVSEEGQLVHVVERGRGGAEG